MRLAGHFGFRGLVFVDTPTGNHLGPPSTSFGGGSPLRGAAALGSLRSPSLRRPQKGLGRTKQTNLQKHFYTGFSGAGLEQKDAGFSFSDAGLGHVKASNHYFTLLNFC
jgi:hypothetical protein